MHDFNFPGGQGMRMWMLNPKFLCRQHLLGEHSEIHKFRHNFVKKHKVIRELAKNIMIRDLILECWFNVTEKQKYELFEKFTK